MTDTSSDSNLDIAQPDDFFVTRDGDGELQPVTQPLPDVEQEIRVVPITMDDMNDYGDSGGQLNPANLDAETTAEILGKYYYNTRIRDDFHQTILNRNSRAVELEINQHAVPVISLRWLRHQIRSTLPAQIWYARMSSPPSQVEMILRRRPRGRLFDDEVVLKW